MPKTGDGSGKATGGKMTSLASSLAGKAPSVSRVGSGVQGAVQRVKERPGVSASAMRLSVGLSLSIVSFSTLRLGRVLRLRRLCVIGSGSLRWELMLRRLSLR